MAYYERPGSRFTREKTKAAMYAQHIAARYALVPFSLRINAIAVIPCKTVEGTLLKNEELWKRAKECDAFFDHMLDPIPTNEGDPPPKPPLERAPDFLTGIRYAVILGRSSDFYRYSLVDEGPAEGINFRLGIAGIHDSMLPLPVWETYTNKRYDAHALPVDIEAPGFSKLRKTQYGHNILVGALICGDPRAIALKEKQHMHPKTRQRIEKEVSDLQHKRYRGRPLAFWNEEKRVEVAHKISYSVIEHYRQKKAL